MKNLCKGLTIAIVVAACGILWAPKVNAQAIVQTDYTTLPGLVETNPIVLSQPAIIEASPALAPMVLNAPEVINSGPAFLPYGYGYGRGFRHHLLDMGMPGLLNFSLF